MQQSKWQSFVSLRWYDGFIKFVFNFVAKTSELLLAAGLVVSTANFLTDGSIIGQNAASPVAVAWAWCQATAIDSGLGITFVYVLLSVQRRDWVKVVLYAALTLLLAVVAGAITNIDTLAHSLHIGITDATQHLAINVEALTLLRSLTVVGFILMSRVKDFDFASLYAHRNEQPTSGQPVDASTMTVTPDEIRSMIVDALTNVRVSVAPVDALQLPDKASSHNTGTALGTDEIESETSESLNAAHRRLETVYQAMAASGDEVSASQLAATAHVRKATAIDWLKNKQQEQEQPS